MPKSNNELPKVKQERDTSPTENYQRNTISNTDNSNNGQMMMMMPQQQQQQQQQQQSQINKFYPPPTAENLEQLRHCSNAVNTLHERNRDGLLNQDEKKMFNNFVFFQDVKAEKAGGGQESIKCVARDLNMNVNRKMFKTLMIPFSNKSTIIKFLKFHEPIKLALSAGSELAKQLLSSIDWNAVNDKQGYFVPHGNSKQAREAKKAQQQNNNNNNTKIAGKRRQRDTEEDESDEQEHHGLEGNRETNQVNDREYLAELIKLAVRRLNKANKQRFQDLSDQFQDLSKQVENLRELQTEHAKRMDRLINLTIMTKNNHEKQPK